MPAWCNSPDCQAAEDEIKLEIKTRGWDRLSKTSPKDQLAIGMAEKRQFVPHLERAYPDARKDFAAWLKFIDKMTGQVRLRNSAFTAYKQAANQTQNLALSEARLKRRLGKGLSQEDLTEPGLVLSPVEEQLVAGQVNVLCVCAYVKVCVCAWMAVLGTILTGCAGTLHSVRLGSSAGLVKGSVKRTSQSQAWSSVPQKKS